MEDKKLTPQESMQLISDMIQNSKHRVAISDLRISLMWGILTILTAATVLTLLLTIGSSWANVIWFAIPVIGIPLNIMMAKKDISHKRATTFIDNVGNGIWKIVGFIALALSAGCLVVSILGYNQIWQTMFFYAFIIVGFGAATQGVMVKEKSYIFGGVVSILTGFTIIGAYLCHIPLPVTWTIPLYICCFLLMFIVPGLIIARKLK